MPRLAQLIFTGEAVFFVLSLMSSSTSEAKLVFSSCLPKQLHMMDEKIKLP